MIKVNNNFLSIKRNFILKEQSPAHGGALVFNIQKYRVPASQNTLKCHRTCPFRPALGFEQEVPHPTGC